MWHKEVPVSMGLEVLHRRLQSIKEGKSVIIFIGFFSKKCSVGGW
jgi:hypothetical protein